MFMAANKKDLASLVRNKVFCMQINRLDYFSFSKKL